MNGFVGSQILETEAEVSAIIQNLASSSPYYFLRWPHKVSGIITQTKFEQEFHPQGLSPVGQVFTQDWELRWERRSRRLTKKPAQYHLLWLGKIEAEAIIPGFTALEENQRPIAWKTVDYLAVSYQEDSSEGTRFPRGFRIPADFSKESLQQRHFIQAKTGITQFVALVSPTA